MFECRLKLCYRNFDYVILLYSPFTELLGNLDELKNVRHSDPRPSQQKKISVVKSGKTDYFIIRY